ncbi:hypothetical protein EWM60_07525 [Candidatus Erwinia dacicola]|uniref:Transposase for insertion sequence element IS21-like C-terminal domain-containing protein n=1 Tax=Candidatus Erwinia dacicola TaxID=252393 RepID=A0A1E7Z372_9GAMM|nr:hypothetical protein [Candidatus Erwinia dacicola]OFC63095.1 hypothetical protein BBW68_01225 [Candidatus Erwinia dacicola]
MNIDYHVEYELRHYSVPHQYVGKTVELHAFDNLLEVWADGPMIASHPRRFHPGNSTAAEHMPERHRHHQQWTPGRLKNWAAGVGSDTGRVRQGGVNSDPAFRSGNMSVKR